MQPETRHGYAIAQTGRTLVVPAVINLPVWLIVHVAYRTPYIDEHMSENLIQHGGVIMNKMRLVAFTVMLSFLTIVFFLLFVEPADTKTSMLALGCVP